jgi:2-beta-glucuronyltransferase
MGEAGMTAIMDPDTLTVRAAMREQAVHELEPGRECLGRLRIKVKYDSDPAHEPIPARRAGAASLATGAAEPTTLDAHTAAVNVSTRRVVLLSGHYLGSKRRAGFHHLASAFLRAGWDVTFATVGISLLSRLRGDYRFAYSVREEANRLVSVRERLTSYVLMTRMHPGNLRFSLANRLSTPWFARYAGIPLGQLEARLREADLIVFEGTAGLLLVERVRGLAPRARLVYRASDDLRSLGVHPLVLQAESRAIPLFDLVSAPTQQIARLLAPYGRVEVHPPGIDKAALDTPSDSPYGDGPAAVFAGVSPLFDYESLTAAAELAPHIAFHVIGPPSRPVPANVFFHPELPFTGLVPYLKHATFGLLFFPPGYASLGQGNKIAQYSYCRLPIVAPSHLEADRANVCVFDPGDRESLGRALAEAERMPHSPAFAEGIMSAEDLAAILAGETLAPGSA